MEEVEILSFNNILEKKSKVIEIRDVEDLKQLEGLDINVDTICFTGNRPARLPWKNNEDCSLCVDFKQRLNKLLEIFIEKGAKRFIIGGALGFDTIAGEAVLAFRDNLRYKITLELAIPCVDQTSKWKQEDIERYNEIKMRVDKVTYVSDKPYSPECYAVRNKYMVDNSDVVVACMFAKRGGTMQTFNYATKTDKNIIIIN